MRLIRNVMLNQTIYVIMKFKTFLENYKSVENNVIYLKKILKNHVSENNVFNIDVLHIAEFDFFLFSKLIQNPRKIICLFDYVINKITINNVFKKKEKKSTRACVFNDAGFVLSRYDPLSLKNINRLVKIQGYIVKYDNLILEMSSAFFICQNCFFEIYSFLEQAAILKPFYCFYCKVFNSFQLTYNRCNFITKQFIQIHQIKDCNQLVVLYYQPSVQLKIGDFVEIIGIHRVRSFRHSFCSGNFFFKSFLESLFFYKIKPRFDVSSFKCRIDLHRKQFEKKTAHTKILLSSILQNFYLHIFFADNVVSSVHGFDTVGHILCLYVVFFKDVNFSFFSKLFSVVLLNRSNIKDFFSFYSANFFENFYFSAKQDVKFFFFEKNVFFFLFCALSYKQVLFFLKNILHVYMMKLQFDLLLWKQNLRSKLLFKTKNGIFKINNSSFFLTFISAKKKYNSTSKWGRIFFLLLSLMISDFTVYFFLKSFNVINVDRNLFQHNLNILSCSKLLNIVKINKYHNLGFNSKGIDSLSNVLLKINMPFYSKILASDLLRWKNIIKKKKLFEKIKIFRNNYFIINLICFSQMNAKIKLSGNINSMDIRLSVFLVMESLKSLSS